MIAVVVAPPLPQFIPQELINQPVPVVNPPPWLAAVQPGSPGSTIQAVVQSTNADGLTTVVSSAGTLSFQAPTSLVNTSQILLQVTQSSSGQPQVQIVQVTAPAPPPAYSGAVLSDLTPQGVASLPIPGAIVVAQIERTVAPVDGPTLALQNAVGAAAGLTPGSVSTAPILAGASPLAGEVAAVAINTIVTPTATVPTVPTALLAQALASAPPIGAITDQAVTPGQRSPNQGGAAGQQPAPQEHAGTAAQQPPSAGPGAVPPGPGTTVAASEAAVASEAQIAAQTPQVPPAAGQPAPGQTTTTATVSAPSLAPESQTVPLALANATVGQRISVQIVSIAPPGGPGNSAGAAALAGDQTAGAAAAVTTGTVAAATAKSASTFVATVVGSDAAGQPILATGPLLITLASGAPPPGTKVTLAVAPETVAMASTNAFPASAEVASAAALMNASQGTSAAQAVTSLIPQAGPALAAQMAFYAGAMQQGDIKVWLGDAARAALDRTQKGRAALSDLGDDMENTAEVNASAGPGNWQAMTIPFANGAVVDPIRLYMLQTDPDAEGETAGSPPDAARFLVDVQLTRLGRFQIDGFARPDRLDLIVRTPTALDPAIKAGVEQVYINTASARGLGGLIAFQVAPPIVPPTPMPPPRPSAGILV
jgi:hypothetical protein